MAPDPSMVEGNDRENNNTISNNIIIENEEEREDTDEGHQPYSTGIFTNVINASNKLINMRELKQIIYKEVSEEREIYLSDMDLGCDPSNILVTFLHLANEKNLTVKEACEAGDVVLGWN